tara:strand:+ start:1096 stop:1218 length:123 start_codon:yes stop_codon:yes gene_type:complete
MNIYTINTIARDVFGKEARELTSTEAVEVYDIFAKLTKQA